jgi:predicted transcriptional regulator
MVKNAFSHQFLVELSQKSDKLLMPSFLKEAVKKLEFSDFDKLHEFLKHEVQNSSLQDGTSVQYFLFISRAALLHFFYRKDLDQFQGIVEVVRHRMLALRGVHDTEFPVAAWEQYLALLEVATKRLMRHVPIETFEEEISKLDWSLFGQEDGFIADLSTLLGFAYMNEEEKDQSVKARIWLQKALHEHSGEEGLLSRLFLVSYYQLEGGNELKPRIEQQLEAMQQTRAKTQHETIARIYDNAIFELEATHLRNTIAAFDDALTRLENSQLRLKELETSFAQHQTLPNFTRAYVESVIASLYAQLYSMTDDDLEQASFSKHAVQHAEHAVGLAEGYRDTTNAMSYRLQRVRLAVDTQHALTEKELKELIQFYKKMQDYPSYLAAQQAFFDLLVRNGNAAKTYDQVLDIFKWGNKKISQGGFYLIASGMKMANAVFVEETENPGVSWMVEVLDGYFERVIQVIKELDEHLETVGRALVETFRSIYLDFEPASHFNIKVYLLYQLYAIKIARLGAVVNQDELSLRVIDKLLAELEDVNNPLSFIQSDWEEFKLVPNSVRNKTLNKCINISKGDLPLAAEHLDFSYRNLRSYITFKEVNRLGFFLDIQQTNNRQLEQGIRYMFFDLYKRGTIFEVVFDMPKFLVKYSKTGFFSQDLEEELNIKGTTAKKYIKIMIEIGLIRQDKTTGRKHYYRLVRENVMNRLGADQTTMIG